MASRRPRMPRVPGAQRAQGPARPEDGAAAQEAAGQDAEVVELRRAAEAADASVSEDADRIVAERGVGGETPDAEGAKVPKGAREKGAAGRDGKDAEEAAEGRAPKGAAAAKDSEGDRDSAVSSSRIAREPDSTVARLRPSAAASRPGGATLRRTGPGRTAEQAAQDAARRRQPAPKPVPARSVTGRSLVVIAVVFIAATLMAPTLRVYLNQSLEMSAAQTDIADQQRKKAEYEQRIARWEDPEYVKQQARDRLDLVMPGETLYMVTGKDRLQKAPEQTASTQEEPVNEHLPWAEGLWDSVVRAATE